MNSYKQLNTIKVTISKLWEDWQWWDGEGGNLRRAVYTKDMNLEKKKLKKLLSIEKIIWILPNSYFI